MLSRFGLTWKSFESSNGEEAAKQFSSIVNHLSDTSVPSNLKIQLSSALLTWQSVAPESTQDDVFKHHSESILEVILTTVLLPDDGFSRQNNYSFGCQMTGLFLAQLLSRHSRQSYHGFARAMSMPLIGVLRTCQEKKVKLEAKDPKKAESAPTIRTDTLTTLMTCLPEKGNLNNESPKHLGCGCDCFLNF